MKEEIVPEFLWHMDKVLLSFQVSIVTTIDEQGRVNAAPFSLVFPFSCAANPQMMIVTYGEWHTAKNILATKEFVINYAPYSLIKQVGETSLFYPEGVNELDKAGLTAIPSLIVKPPRIKECYQHIECRMNQVLLPNEMQKNFIGDVVSITANEEILNAHSRQEKLRKGDPLMLYGMELMEFHAFYGGIEREQDYAPPNTAVEEEY